MSPLWATAVPARRSSLSALLFDAGAVNRLGRVDDGTTVTDYDEEEIARKHTLACSLAYARVEQAQNQPHRHARDGQFPERRARRRCASRTPRSWSSTLSHGAEVSTEKVWAAAEELGCRASSCSTGSTASARASSARSSRCARVFGRAVVPIQLPIGEDRGFRGVVDLVSMKAWTFADRRERQADGRPTSPARAPRAGAGGARGAHRDGRRSRRRADGEVLRRRHADAGGARRRG